MSMLPRFVSVVRWVPVLAACALLIAGTAGAEEVVDPADGAEAATGEGAAEDLEDAEKAGEEVADDEQAVDADTEVIFVTANKREEDIQDVAVSVTALDAQFIEKSGLTEFNQIQKFVPNLSIEGGTDTRSTSMRIRGIGSVGTNAGIDPSVGLFIDGVYQGRAGMSMSDLIDVESIEVLRGPQGTLYGKNTAAGLINIRTHRLFANAEFADPNIYSRQDRTSDFTSQAVSPLTYAVTTDPITGVRDGILKRPATDPLVFHVDTSNEFWQMKASLNVHDGRGDPVTIPPNVRLYLLASHPHGGAAGVGHVPTDAGECAYPTNTYRSSAPAMRALLVALDAWADAGVEPPASRYPDVRRGTLGTVDEVGRTFPAIPGVRFPAVVNGLQVLNFGPTFGPRGGRRTLLPPVAGDRYEVLVPTVDADGHDVAGIRSIDIEVPVGTSTGWNLYAPGPGATTCVA